MKQHHIGTQTEQWGRELVWEYQDYQLKINTVQQTHRGTGMAVIDQIITNEYAVYNGDCIEVMKDMNTD